MQLLQEKSHTRIEAAAKVASAMLKAHEVSILVQKLNINTVVEEKYCIKVIDSKIYNSNDSEAMN